MLPEFDVPVSGTWGHSKMTGWLEEIVSDGEAYLKGQTGYSDIDANVRYIMSDYSRRDDLKGIAFFPVNRAAKAHNERVAILTDVKPIYEYRTMNPAYEATRELLNKINVAWWINNDVDLALADTISWGDVAGVGWAKLDYVRAAQAGMGDTELVGEIDPRDVIPIQPGRHRHRPQKWLGVVVVEKVPLQYARQAYPEFGSRLVADCEFAVEPGRMKTTSVMDRLRGSTKDKVVQGVKIYHVYFRDPRRNTSGMPLVVGSLDTNYGYAVEPRELLYPRGRLIVMTSSTVLSDGPNPYWHGMHPVAKWCGTPYPWSYWGKPSLKDVIPLNDLLNEMVSKVAQAARKTLKPGIWRDANAGIDNAAWNNLNPEAAGWKLTVNQRLPGNPIGFTDPVTLPPYISELIRLAIDQIDDLSGTRNLAELMQLKQMPGAETLETIQQVLTPVVKRQGRLIEAFLRDIAEMQKYNVFQFYTTSRRIQLLGPDGMTAEDLDYDPGNLIPAASPADNEIPIEERLRRHAAKFPCFISPNSLLDIAKTQVKLQAMMLRRMGEIDHKTFLEKLDMDAGEIAKIDSRLSSEIDQKIAAAAQPQPGRPPTAQALPNLQVKEGGRPTVAET